MKAKYGLPLALGLAALLSTAIVLPSYKRQQEAAAQWQHMTASHNPHLYRTPVCSSRTHDGWGLYFSEHDLNYHVVQPGRVDEILIGSYTQYPELRDLYCAEAR